MSQLYRLNAPAAAIAAVFGADAGRDPWPGGDIAPGQPAPVVLRNRDGDRYLAPRIWGVPPPVSFSIRQADPQDYRPVTTVRNTQSPFWIGNLRHTQFRCLVPITHFPIWSAAPDPRTGKRRLHWASLPAQPIFALAGIWRDSEVVSFAYLTTQANEAMAAINPSSSQPSMPVILHPEDHETWLSADWNSAQALVEPYPAAYMQVD
jgi:putative SOS response-associated peptidase YedK